MALGIFSTRKNGSFHCFPLVKTTLRQEISGPEEKKGNKPLYIRDLFSLKNIKIIVRPLYCQQEEDDRSAVGSINVDISRFKSEHRVEFKIVR